LICDRAVTSASKSWASTLAASRSSLSYLGSEKFQISESFVISYLVCEAIPEFACFAYTILVVPVVIGQGLRLAHEPKPAIDNILNTTFNIFITFTFTSVAKIRISCQTTK
jgi:ABC-type molybdate transport system permease subunit